MQINKKYWNIVKLVADMNYDPETVDKIHTPDGELSQKAFQIREQCKQEYGKNPFKIMDCNVYYLYLFLQQVECDDLDASIDPKDVEELKKLVEEELKKTGRVSLGYRSVVDEKLFN